MIISGAVEAHKLILDSDEVNDNTSVQLPSFESLTTEIKGAGIAGAFEMSLPGIFGSMKLGIAQRSLNKKSGILNKPGIRNIEVRAAVRVMDGDESKVVAVKVFATCIALKSGQGKIESGSPSEGDADFEILRYRQIVDGVETLLCDKRNYIFKVDGVDYLKELRAAIS